MVSRRGSAARQTIDAPVFQLLSSRNHKHTSFLFRGFTQHYHSNSLCIINTMAYVYLSNNNEQLTHFERKNGFFADAKSGAFFYERT